MGAISAIFGGVSLIVLARFASRWGPALLALLPHVLRVLRAAGAWFWRLGARVPWPSLRLPRVRVRARVSAPAVVPLCLPGAFGRELYRACWRFGAALFVMALPLMVCGVMAYFYPIAWVPYVMMLAFIVRPLVDVVETGYAGAIVRRGIACPPSAEERG